MVDFAKKLKQGGTAPRPDLASDVARRIIESLHRPTDFADDQPAGTNEPHRPTLNAEDVAAVGVLIVRDRADVATWYRARITDLFKVLKADQGECQGCGKVIWWVTTPSGARSPYTMDGLSHFADCPNRDRFKR